jgi:ActD protein
MNGNSNLYGLMAEFTDHEQVVNAAKRAHEQGYRCMDAYTPFPVEDLPEALGHKGTAVPLIVLMGGIVGALGGYVMEWYSMAVDYPINIGGRPFHSWPAYIPITFELMVLCASLSAIVGMLALNRLPQPHHPVFNLPEFERASTDRFFLCIEARDPKFDGATTRQFLESFKPNSVQEVAA